MFHGTSNFNTLSTAVAHWVAVKYPKRKWPNYVLHQGNAQNHPILLLKNTINPSHPNIIMHILHNVLSKFPLLLYQGKEECVCWGWGEMRRKFTEPFIHAPWSQFLTRLFFPCLFLQRQPLKLSCWHKAFPLILVLQTLLLFQSWK